MKSRKLSESELERVVLALEMIRANLISDKVAIADPAAFVDALDRLAARTEGAGGHAPLASAGLSPRTSEALRRAGIVNAGQLRCLPNAWLYGDSNMVPIRSFGKGAQAEVLAWMAAHGEVSYLPASVPVSDAVYSPWHFQGGADWADTGLSYQKAQVLFGLLGIKTLGDAADIDILMLGECLQRKLDLVENTGLIAGRVYDRLNTMLGTYGLR